MDLAGLARLSRRRLLAASAALAAGLVAVPRGAAAPAARALIPRELLFGDPEVAWARLSPDGMTLAYLAPVDGVRNLWVAPVGEPGAAHPSTRLTGRPIGYFRWAFTSRAIVFFVDRDGDENWRASRVDVGTGEILALTPERGVRAFVQAASPRVPGEMLLAHNARDRRFFDVFRVDLATGRGRLVFENDRFAWLLADLDLRVRAGGRYLEDGSVEWLERRPDGAWALLLTVPIGDVDATRPLDFSADGSTLYLLDSRGRDKAALLALDMATRRTRV